jgi:threonine/homoserine/homoserine lactone efflux protein
MLIPFDPIEVNLGPLITGIAIGFCIAAPVGPIGILCITRSLAQGWRIGICTGLGAATADAVYGAVAAFGLTAISDFLNKQRFWLGVIGGAFLCWLAVKTFRSRPPARSTEDSMRNGAAAYLSTVFLTLTNPATILSFGIIFANAGVARTTDYASACWLTAGVLAGSGAWWLILSSASAALRTRLDSRWLKGVNILSGTILGAFGMYSIWRAVW